MSFSIITYLYLLTRSGKIWNFCVLWCGVSCLFLLSGRVPGLDSLDTSVYQGLIGLVMKETDEDAGHVVTAQSSHLAVRRQTPAQHSYQVTVNRRLAGLTCSSVPHRCPLAPFPWKFSPWWSLWLPGWTRRPRCRHRPEWWSPSLARLFRGEYREDRSQSAHSETAYRSFWTQSLPGRETGPSCRWLCWIPQILQPPRFSLSPSRPITMTCWDKQPSVGDPHHGLVVGRERFGHPGHPRYTPRVPRVGAPELLAPDEGRDCSATCHLLLQTLRSPHRSVALQESLLDCLLDVAIFVLRPQDYGSVKIVGSIGGHFRSSVAIKYSEIPDN